MNAVEKQKKEEQINNLIKFAEHLKTIKKFQHQLFEEIELVDVSKKVRKHYKVVYNFCVFEELPAIFNEFEFSDETSDTILIGKNSDESTAASVIEFFGLSGPEQFAHLFDVEGLQNPIIYGGKILTLEATPSDFAFNIYQFVRFRKFELQPRLGK
jgi:hypothetical protein